jgi:hypothetical protein
MSRSHRKPYYGNADGAKDWKRKANRKLRRNIKDFPDGNTYKKFNEVWTSPMEHKKGYWDIPKLKRK